MRDIIYFGLFFDDKTRNRLLTVVKRHWPSLLNSASKIYVDHCTLLHKSKYEGFPELYSFLKKNIGRTVTVSLIAVGISRKAMAFQVQFTAGEEFLCANWIPHITVFTFGDGKPVDSNYIESWVEIDPIDITTTIQARYGNKNH